MAAAADLSLAAADLSLADEREDTSIFLYFFHGRRLS
jgi:hypothetical protein